MNRRDLLKAIAGAAAATFLGGLQLTARRSHAMTNMTLTVGGVEFTAPHGFVVGVDYGVPGGHFSAYTLMEKQDDGAWHVVESSVEAAP